jgi:hypothetical protein
MPQTSSLLLRITIPVLAIQAASALLTSGTNSTSTTINNNKSITVIAGAHFEVFVRVSAVPCKVVQVVFTAGFHLHFLLGSSVTVPCDCYHTPQLL